MNESVLSRNRKVGEVQQEGKCSLGCQGELVGTYQGVSSGEM